MNSLAEPLQTHAQLKLCCVNLKMAHHAGPSGYDQLAHELDADVVNGTGPLSITDRATARLLRSYIRNSGVQWYTRNSMCAELVAAFKLLKGSSNFVHFLYGENSYRYLAAIRRIRQRKCWLTATFHTPIWRLRELVKDVSHIAQLDAAIVVSTTQIPFFEELLGRRVHFVPHGINTDFYKPGGAVDSNVMRFVMVGSHLRDFDLADSFMRTMQTRYPGVVFDVVARASDLERFKNRSNICTYSKISDEHLRNLYRGATALVLPLLDCTANNALLEGMACGVPIVVTDLPGVRDYVGPESAILLESNPDQWVETLSQFSEGDVDSQSLSTASRRQAEKYSWPLVGATMRHTLERISRGG